AFADAEDTVAYRAALSAGLSWGEAKQRLLQKVDEQIAPLRERYETLIARPADIEDVLQAGAAKARAIAAPLLEELHEAVGLRRFRAPVTTTRSNDSSEPA
ncbi:tryptophan--tRNA ligase, partial [Xanthomonadaceae bacterium JHOS43]|nr:tryptophan--tRNA ligase [Xanthomonadaceae bacterium JHOS43]